MANPNLPSFCLKPIPLVNYTSLKKFPLQFFCKYWRYFKYWKVALRLPQSLLLCRKNNPNSLSLREADIELLKKYHAYRVAPGAPFAPLSTYEYFLVLIAVCLLGRWQHSSVWDHYSPWRKGIVKSFVHNKRIFQITAWQLYKIRLYFNWTNNTLIWCYNIFPPLKTSCYKRQWN